MSDFAMRASASESAPCTLQQIVVAKRPGSREDYGTLAISDDVPAQLGMVLKRRLLQGWTIESSTGANGGTPEAIAFFRNSGAIVVGRHYVSGHFDVRGRAIYVTHFGVINEERVSSDVSPDALMRAIAPRIDLTKLEGRLPCAVVESHPASGRCIESLDAREAQAALHVVLALLGKRSCVLPRVAFTDARKIWAAVLALWPHALHAWPSFLESNTPIAAEAPFDVVIGHMNSTDCREVVDGRAVPPELCKDAWVNLWTNREIAGFVRLVEDVATGGEQREGTPLLGRAPEKQQSSHAPFKGAEQVDCARAEPAASRAPEPPPMKKSLIDSMPVSNAELTRIEQPPLNDAHDVITTASDDRNDKVIVVAAASEETALPCVEPRTTHEHVTAEGTSTTRKNEDHPSERDGSAVPTYQASATAPWPHWMTTARSIAQRQAAALAITMSSLLGVVGYAAMRPDAGASTVAPAPPPSVAPTEDENAHRGELARIDTPPPPVVAEPPIPRPPPPVVAEPPIPRPPPARGRKPASRSHTAPLTTTRAAAAAAALGY